MQVLDIALQNLVGPSFITRDLDQSIPLSQGSETASKDDHHHERVAGFRTDIHPPSFRPKSLFEVIMRFTEP